MATTTPTPSRADLERIIATQAEALARLQDDNGDLQMRANAADHALAQANLHADKQRKMHEESARELDDRHSRMIDLLMDRIAVVRQMLEQPQAPLGTSSDYLAGFMKAAAAALPWDPRGPSERWRSTLASR